MRRIRFRTVLALAIALLGLSTALQGAPATPDPSGIWTVKVDGPNGHGLDATLTLVWTGNQLSGTIDNRAGKVDIGEAKFAGDQVSFTVTRRIRFRKFVVNYTGKLEGDTINGTLDTKGRGSKSVSMPWHATRAK